MIKKLSAAWENHSLNHAVGNTPLIYLKHLSKATGNHLLVKAEYLLPGGSIKDRTSLGLIQHLERNGRLKPGMTLYEGTAGNTGIGLATLAPHLGYQVHIVMPDNQSAQKYELLRLLGAKLTLVPAVPFSNPHHFYHTAKNLAAMDPLGVWVDQFENPGNWRYHYEHTATEIWQQTGGQLDFFGASCGTGGSLAGVSRFLKEQNPQITCYLFDPEGSGLAQYVRTGQFQTQGQSLTEGIGIMRLTHNFSQARVDGAWTISDHKLGLMLAYLAKHEGLFVGLSSALNVFGLYQWSILHRDQGKVGLTWICDHGSRYSEKVQKLLSSVSGIPLLEQLEKSVTLSDL